MIRKILFDIDGTLLDFDASARIAMEAACKKRGYPWSDAVMEGYYRINKRMWEAHERGELTREYVLSQRFVELFAGMGIEEDGEAFDALFREGLNEYPVLIPGAEEILEYLEGRYEMYVVTNGVAETQIARMAKTGLDRYFKEMFISERIGSHKPQREFFEYCLERMGDCVLDEMILIGDSLSADIRGANRMGIPSVWINPARKPNPGIAFPDFEISSLSLLRILL